MINQTIFSSVTSKSSAPADGGATIYGLGLSSTLNLSNASQISHAQATISAAMGVAYGPPIRTWSQASTPQTAAQQVAANNGSANNPVPAYLTDQLANLQAGLARLTGGSSSSGSTISSLI